MRLATGLESHDPTRAALAEGRIHVEQAEAILRALTELPDDLDPEVARQGRAAPARRSPPTTTPKPSSTWAGTSSRSPPPTPPTPTKPNSSRREERDAAAATRLTMWDDGHGKVHGRFTLDALTGAMLKKALYAFAAPKHRASQGPLGERRPTPERLGQAFVELIQRYPTKRLPKAGGLNATVVVLMTLDTLMGGLKAAQLDTGETISPGQARRLACEARIIPAVLGGKSEVLDLGRAKRFYQRTPPDQSHHRTTRLRRRRLRLATRHDPHAPPHPLGRRRPNQQRRHHDLPTPPRPSPRPALR